MAYSFSILTWIGYGLLKKTSRESSANLLMSQRWDQGLGELRHPIAGDSSLIPMFERMVDRAFSHTPRDPDGAESEEKHLVHKISAPGKATPSFSARALPKDLVR
jgi:hypothetical protein